MPKVELIVESKPDDDFLKGHCSACPDARFNLSGNSLAQKALLRNMFDVHLRRVHPDDSGAVGPQAKVT